jgi:hypothetical protein
VTAKRKGRVLAIDPARRTKRTRELRKPPRLAALGGVSIYQENRRPSSNVLLPPSKSNLFRNKGEVTAI